jgi:RNA polymerase sigma-70 factor (ECF subfamily)
MHAAVAVPIPSGEQTDLDLAQRHRYGDSAAFEEVYRRFGSMVYNLALRLAGDPDEAADLTQEVFVRAFRHLGKYRGGASLKTWLYRVALNHCRSRLRRRRRRLLLPLAPEAQESLADPDRGPEQSALAHDLGRCVERALAALPPVFREAVVLRDLEGLSYEEIARILRVRLGTVRSRIARGREQLRQLLAEGR